MTTPTREEVQAMIDELREQSAWHTAADRRDEMNPTCARKLEHAAAMLEALMPNDPPVVDLNIPVLHCPKCGSMEVSVTLPNDLQWMPKNFTQKD